MSGLLLVAVLAVGAACDDEGTSIIGEWELVTVGGDPLPVRVLEEPGDTTSLLGGTLEFDAGDTYELGIMIEHRYAWDGDELIVDTIEGTQDGEWSRTGDEVEITTEFFGQDVVDTLFVEGGRLVQRGGLFGDIVYERADG